MKDLLSGEEFVPKKNTQKFATPANRIKYNNIKASTIRKQKAYIDKPLNQNYRILENLMIGKDEAIYHQQFLLGRGFDFRAVTGTENYNGKQCFCIYQFILSHAKEFTKISKK